MKKRISKSKNDTRGLHVVALGGGTGLSTLLRGLKELVVRRRDETVDPQHPIANLTDAQLDQRAREMAPEVVKLLLQGQP